MRRSLFRNVRDRDHRYHFRGAFCIYETWVICNYKKAAVVIDGGVSILNGVETVRFS